jgi:hypothetical protein
MSPNCVSSKCEDKDSSEDYAQRYTQPVAPVGKKPLNIGLVKMSIRLTSASYASRFDISKMRVSARINDMTTQHQGRSADAHSLSLMKALDSSLN